MNESQLVHIIKAHVAKGDKAAEKSEQHYIAAGQHLKTLKAQMPKGIKWEQYIEDLGIGIGRSRANELIQIADGRKTVEELQNRKAESVAKSRAALPLRSGENADDPAASAEAMKTQFADDDESAACEEIAPPLADQPHQSWRVQVTDESGKVWSNGVRLAAKDGAARYMAYALYDFRDSDSAIVEMRTIESDDAPNVWAVRQQKGPRKGRVGNTLIFDCGCHSFQWHESATEKAGAIKSPPPNDDGLDIPEILSRVPKAVTS